MQRTLSFSMLRHTLHYTWLNGRVAIEVQIRELWYPAILTTELDMLHYFAYIKSMPNWNLRKLP